MKTIFVLVVLGLAACLADKVSYENYKVFKVVPQNDANVEILSRLAEMDRNITFWNELRGPNQPVSVMVPPDQVKAFVDFINLRKMEHQVAIENVEELIQKTKPRGLTKAFGWEDYYRLADVYAWLDQIAAENPDKVSVVVGGSSYEGREIKGVKVSFSAANENNAIFIEGGIHAREWISVATVTYILNEILTSTDPAVRAMAERYDWYIFPSFNPDGYEYTFEGDRLWRKTRQPYGLCTGADPNRNWGYHWMNGGASDRPCSETYAGSSAFSEIETKSMSEYITSIQDKLVGYIGFHSFSQLLLIPYGDSSAHVENYEELYSVGLKAAESLAVRYGTEYTVGNIVEVIYVASGGSMDWVKGNYGTRITYTYELRDTGNYGFLLPAEQIIPTGQETLDSLVTMLNGFN